MGELEIRFEIANKKPMGKRTLNIGEEVHPRLLSKPASVLNCPLFDHIHSAAQEPTLFNLLNILSYCIRAVRQLAVYTLHIC